MVNDAEWKDLLKVDCMKGFWTFSSFVPVINKDHTACDSLGPVQAGSKTARGMRMICLREEVLLEESGKSLLGEHDRKKLLWTRAALSLEGEYMCIQHFCSVLNCLCVQVFTFVCCVDHMVSGPAKSVWNVGCAPSSWKSPSEGEYLSETLYVDFSLFSWNFKGNMLVCLDGK